ncbi:MAG: hypothetical protein ACQCN5_10530 [Candidatus Bathyarchaeia archaeon]|jgi:hypothetical protein
MSTSANEKNAFFLTEAILSIHNEVQSALDYISTVSAEEGTELGKSTALLSIENLRVKVPLKFNIETEKTKPETTPTRTLTPTDVRAALTKRTGLVVERDLTRNLNISSKVKVAFKPEEIPTATTTRTATTTTKTTETPKEEWGEIEITFAPIKRQ